MGLRCIKIIAFLALLLPWVAVAELGEEPPSSASLSAPPFTPAEKAAQYRMLGLLLVGVVVSAGLGLKARRLLQKHDKGNA